MHRKDNVKTRKQIADEYGTSTSTLKRWLKIRNMNLPANELLYPQIQKEIYDTLGYPSGVRSPRKQMNWSTDAGEK